jgi:hypothetical protein
MGRKLEIMVDFDESEEEEEKSPVKIESVMNRSA